MKPYQTHRFCGILPLVITSSYSSGFLYNQRTHRILLLSDNAKMDVPACWSTIGGDNKEGEDAQIAFQRIISKMLKIELKSKDIYPIYDYFHDSTNKFNNVFYAEIRNTKILDNYKKGTLSWFSFAETVKLLLNSQSKQDIMVGERVINAKWRDDRASKESQEILT